MCVSCMPARIGVDLGSSQLRAAVLRHSPALGASLGAAVEPLPCEQRRALKDAFDAARRAALSRPLDARCGRVGQSAGGAPRAGGRGRRRAHRGDSWRRRAARGASTASGSSTSRRRRASRTASTAATTTPRSSSSSTSARRRRARAHRDRGRGSSRSSIRKPTRARARRRGRADRAAARHLRVVARDSPPPTNRSSSRRGSRWRTLCDAARAAKERLLAADVPDGATETVGVPRGDGAAPPLPSRCRALVLRAARRPSSAPRSRATCCRCAPPPASRTNVLAGGGLEPLELRAEIVARAVGGGAAVARRPARRGSRRKRLRGAAAPRWRELRVEAAASAHAASVLEQASRLRLASAAGRSRFAPIAKSPSRRRRRRRGSSRRAPLRHRLARLIGTRKRAP